MLQKTHGTLRRRPESVSPVEDIRIWSHRRNSVCSSEREQKVGRHRSWSVVGRMNHHHVYCLFEQQQQLANEYKREFIRL